MSPKCLTLVLAAALLAPAALAAQRLDDAAPERFRAGVLLAFPTTEPPVRSH